MLQLLDLNLSYGNAPVLTGVNLTLRQGEKLAILGPSGGGKTTLLHHIHSKLPPDSAALCVQSKALVDNLSVFHNIYMGSLARHRWPYNLLNLIWPLPSERRQVATLCQQLELTQSLSRPVTELSGGQRQRVALGRALHQKMPLLLADEPFSALDAAMSRRLLTVLDQRFSSQIMVMHDAKLACEAFDRVIGIGNGHLMFDLPAADVTEQQLSLLYQQSPPKAPDNVIESA